jgi:hypothetical protein
LGHNREATGGSPRKKKPAMRITLRVLILVVFVWACCPDAWPQVIETPNGRLEFVGLEKWDVAAIEQKLGYNALENPSCNFRHELTGKLGFADAHCASYAEEGRPYKVITVLEPESSARIKYLPEPMKRLDTPQAWTELLHVVTEQEFLNTILDYGSTFESAITKETLMPAEDEKWFVFLQERRSDADFDLALDRLSQDGDYKHRVVAAMVLTNFGQRDSAWRALVGGLRDANEVVRVVCAEALLSLAHYTPRRVDWSASTSDLNLLLSGTNLFAYAWVIEILVETEVSPRLARPLLKGEACELLLAYLSASHNHEREIAHELLAQLSGRDFGFDGRRWRAWVAAVQT